MVDGGRDVVEMHPGALGIVAGILGIVLWALAVTALVLAIITMIRRLRRPGAPLVAGPAPGFSAVAPVPVEPPVVSTTALQILNDRFARGEIGQEEYLERRTALLG